MVSDTTVLDSRPKSSSRFSFAALVTALDDRLRRRLGVFQYSDSPECVFRIQPTLSRYESMLSDGTHIRVGDPIINLHVWNEQFPPFPAGGPTLGWARHVNQAFEQSLRELSSYLQLRSDLQDVLAICGDLAFEPPRRAGQLTHFVARFGFEPVKIQQQWSLAAYAHWLGQNMLISMMVLAHNAAALRADTLWRVRIPVFLSRRALEARYGSGRAPPVKQLRPQQGVRAITE